MVDFLILLTIVDTFFEVVVIFIFFTFSHIINVFIIKFSFFHLVIFHTILPLSFFFLKVIPYFMNFLINLFTLEPIFFLLFPTIFTIDRVFIIYLFTFCNPCIYLCQLLHMFMNSIPLLKERTKYLCP